MNTAIKQESTVFLQKLNEAKAEGQQVFSYSTNDLTEESHIQETIKSQGLECVSKNFTLSYNPSVHFLIKI